MNDDIGVHPPAKLNNYIGIIGKIQPVRLTDNIGPLPPDQLNDDIGTISNSQPDQLIDNIGPLPPTQLNDDIGTIGNIQPVRFYDDIGGKSDSSYAVKDTSSYESDWEESCDDELLDTTKDE